MILFPIHSVGRVERDCSSAMGKMSSHLLSREAKRILFIILYDNVFRTRPHRPFVAALLCLGLYTLEIKKKWYKIAACLQREKVHIKQMFPLANLDNG